MDGGPGDRAKRLAAQREAERRTFEERKAALEASRTAPMLVATSEKFTALSTAATVAEAAFKAETVGFKTLADFTAATAAAAAAASAAAAAASAGPSSLPAPPPAAKRKRPVMSFGDDEEEEEVGAAAATVPASRPAARLGKDPTVATDFLPDADREAKLARLRVELSAEWEAEQAALKASPLTVTYSYWDGTGHRDSVTLPRGATIGKFIEAARAQLATLFPDLRSASSAQLLFVKEDVILPQHFTFHDLITTHARGKSGPLFQWAVVHDVRIGAVDSRVPTADSHPGKLVLRKWYEDHKHVFPASKWEIWDPNRDYTIRGGGVVEEAKKK